MIETSNSRNQFASNFQHGISFSEKSVVGQEHERLVQQVGNKDKEKDDTKCMFVSPTHV